MSYRRARNLQDRVFLDRLVRIRRYTARDPQTGRYSGAPASDEFAWCLRDSGRSDLRIEADGSTLGFPSAVIVRWDARIESLTGQRVTLTFAEDPDREDTVAKVEAVGRRRYLRLEVEA